MKNTHVFGRALLFAALIASLLGAAPAFGQVSGDISSSTTVRVRTGQTDTASRIAQLKAKADQEIDRRTVALNQLNTRLNDMKHISASDKASLSASIQDQLGAMATLKAKIDADTTLDALKADAKTIASTYRIFLLVIPKGHIDAAADRALAVADLGTDLSTRLAARLTAAAATGMDISALTAKISDMNAKIADAKVQATAALNLTSPLVPDGGDSAKALSNKQALVAARANVAAALKDLGAMPVDSKQVIAGLRGVHIPKPTTSTTTTATTAAPGAHCGGNMATALQCGAGYHCAGDPGSNLPVGDVGGTCVADSSN